MVNANLTKSSRGKKRRHFSAQFKARPTLFVKLRTAQKDNFGADIHEQS